MSHGGARARPKERCHALNAALPPGTPPAQPIGALTFMAAGETLELAPLSVGTHRFECLIHPWMRTVAEQR